VAIADTIPSRVFQPDHGAAQLMEPPGRDRICAIWLVLALDERTAPFAVPVTVQPEVQRGPQMEAGVGDRGDAKLPLRTVGHGDVQHAAEETPVVVSEAQLGP